MILCYEQLCLLVSFLSQISQHLESIKKLEKNLSRSAKDIESIRRKSSDDVSKKSNSVNHVKDFK